VAERVRRKLRSYSTAFKRRVVAETLELGASIVAVARRHGLNANMLFLWRGDPRFGPGRDAAVFLPVEVKRAEVPVTPAGGSGPSPTSPSRRFPISLRPRAGTTPSASRATRSSKMSWHS
jgi:transposase